MDDNDFDPNVMEKLMKMNQEDKIPNMNPNMPFGFGFPQPIQNIGMNPNLLINPFFWGQYQMGVVNKIGFPNCPNQFQPQIQNIGEIWTLIFERKYDDNKITIQINSNESVSGAYAKYRIKSLENDIPLKFSFNGKPLDAFLTISQSGLTNNSIITVEKVQEVQEIQKAIDKNISLIFVIVGTYQQVEIQVKPDELLKNVFEKFRNKMQIEGEAKFIFNSKDLNPESTVKQSRLKNGSKIFVVTSANIEGAGYDRWNYKEINIKFIKISDNINNIISKSELIGLLKLCLLKEISSKLDMQQFMKLPQLISYILQTLKNGSVMDCIINKTIKEVLQKMGGSNIINFSNFVDESINTEKLNEIMKLLEPNDLKTINDIKFRLSNYNDLIKLFNEEFEKAKRESIFEFSVISLVIIEREDFEKFKQEREKCPNRIDKILFHGTSIEPISCILTGLFRKSVDRCYQHGKGVYFTDFLDYCWFYGGDVSNRANKNKIPKVGDNFTLIACSTYYDKKGFRKVKDYKYTPKKNEINFAYAGAKFETLVKPDFRKFVGTEYVIWDLDQICPFMSAKLERNEYCVIWRDNNFSEKPVYNNKFDALFKKFLNERIKYINQMAKYNIYPCETSEEALKLVERKKYNKIILISNVGTNLGGKDFIKKARKIIGNDVIALFLAYNTAHLKWIKDFKNSLFSNEPQFYEEYLDCFSDNKKIEENIKNLIAQMENHYKIKFNFDNDFLKFPNYKESGKYSDLRFKN